MPDAAEVYVPHLGWLRHEPDDAVAAYLNQGWFEPREQAFLWLYLREGDTFVDAGAHFGLYSALAATLGAQVFPVEPNSRVLPYLWANLAGHGAANAAVCAAAICAQSGAVRFYSRGAGLSAYSSVIPHETDCASTMVDGISLDDLAARSGLDCIDLIKLDVEGAELDALAGSQRILAEGRARCLIVECTEANLERSGHTTADLVKALESAGLALFRLEEAARALVPYAPNGPIWFDNLLATREPERVLARLETASGERRRVAAEILARGRDGARLLAEADSLKIEAQQARMEAGWAKDLAADFESRLRRLLDSRYVELGYRLGILKERRD